VVAIYSLIFLKRKFYSHHILGLFLILVGICFVSWGGIRASEKKKEAGEPEAQTSLLGIILLVIGALIVGLTVITEEMLF